MNKELIAEALNNQVDTIQYEDGSVAQQEATVLSTIVLNTRDIDTCSEKEVTDTIYSLQKDVQVRDYIMGVILGADEHSIIDIEFYMNKLALFIDLAPQEYQAAPTTLLSLCYYMQDDTETAIKLVRSVEPTYSLASLLQRVYTTDWPTGAFASMATELHPKVTALIFGKDSND